jgi:hypothetical protein
VVNRVGRITGHRNRLQLRFFMTDQGFEDRDKLLGVVALKPFELFSAQ